MSNVVVTGIAGTLGRLLAERLHLDHKVIGLDRRDLTRKPKDIQVFPYDIRRKRCESIFRNRRIDVVFHLNMMHDFSRSQHDLHSFNVVGTNRILDYVSRYNVKKLIFLSTANVYGARPDNPNYLTEDSLLLGGGPFPEMRSLVNADMLITSFFWKHPQVETVILRPCNILGSVNNGPTRYLSMQRVPTIMGFNPMVQILHETELVEWMISAMEPGMRGIYNIAGPPAVPIQSVIDYLGKPRMPVPSPALKLLLRRASQFSTLHIPTAELQFLRYSCLVDDQRARAELKFRPKLTVSETLDLLKRSPVYRTPLP